MGAGKSTVGRAARPAPAGARSPMPTPRSSGAPGARCARSSSATARRPSARSRRAVDARRCSQRDDAPVIALGGGALGVRRDARARCASARCCVVARRRRRRPPGRASTARRARARWPAIARAFERAAATRARRVYRAAADAIVDAATQPPRTSRGALAQQVWTRPGSAELALRRRAPVAIVDRALVARPRRRRAISSSRAARRAKSAAGARAALARARRARARARRRRSCAPGGGSVTDVGGLRGGDVPARRRLARGADRRSSARSTRRSAARRRSTSPPRTTSARSGSRRRCSATPSCSRRCRAREWAGGMAEVREDRAARRRPAVGARRGLGAGRSATSRARTELVQRCAGFKTLVVAADPRGARARARSSTSGTRSATASRRWPATAASRTASASRSASSPRCASPSSSRASTAGTRRAHGAAARAPRAARARAPGLDPDGGARRDAPRQEAHAPARTAWCCSRRSGGRVYGVAVDERRARRGGTRCHRRRH